MSLSEKIKEDHQIIYKQLEEFMLELSKVKNQANHQHLQKTVAALLSYCKALLEDHFKIEEESIFPDMQDLEKRSRLIADHEEISEKYEKLVLIYEDFCKRLKNNYFNDYDYKSEILFPAYNLTASISHHAQREDAWL